MTKIRNTKKGMAKKTLSISLAVAMLATSNVPVWAAEDLFTDGAAAVETVEAPVEDVFSDAAEEVVEEASVVDEEVDAPVAKMDSSADVNLARYTVSDLKIGTVGEWGIDVTVSGSIKNGATPVTGLQYTWMADGVEAAGGQNVANGTASGDVTTISYKPVKEDFGKTLSLRIYQLGDNDSVIFSQTITGGKVQAKDISNLFTNAPSVGGNATYNGKEQKKAVANVNNFKITTGDGAGITADDFTWNYTQKDKDFTNATTGTDKIKVFGTLSGTNVETSPAFGYVAETKPCEYSINKLTLSANNVEAHMKTTEVQFTGKAQSFDKSDIQVLVKPDANDDFTIDITDALKSKADGLSFNGATNVSKGNVLTVKLVKASSWYTTEVANEILKNFTIPADDISVKTKDGYDIIVRDLNSCTGVVNKDVVLDDFLKNPQGYIKTGEIELTGSDGKTFKLSDLGTNVTFVVTKDAISAAEAGQLGVINDAIRIYPSVDTKNVTGELSLSFRLTTTSLEKATIKVDYKNTTGKALSTKADDASMLSVNYIAKAYDLAKNEYGIKNFTTNLKSTEYELSYDNNVDAGIVKVTMTGLLSYAGSEKNFYFKITPASVNTANASMKDKVTVNTANNADPALYADVLDFKIEKELYSGHGKTTLTQDTDYTVKYYFVDSSVDVNTLITERAVKAAKSGNNVADDYVVAVAHVKKGNYNENLNIVKAAKIMNKSISNVTVKVEKDSYTYTHKAIVPNVTVTDGTTKLYKGEDYTVRVKDNVNVGTATITIVPTATSGYDTTSSATATFEITPAKAEDVKVVLKDSLATDKNVFAYTGRQLKPVVDKVWLGDEDVTEQFATAYPTYGENVNAGKGMGSVGIAPKADNKNFTGTKTELFDIKGKELKGGLKLYYGDKTQVTVTGNVAYNKKSPSKPYSFYYDGQEQTFAETRFTPNALYDVTEGTDYEVKYINNTDAGTAFVAVVAKGNYEGNLGTTSNPATFTVLTTGYKVVDGQLLNASGTIIEKNIVDIVAFKIQPSIFTARNITVNNGKYAGGKPVKPEVSVVVNGRTLVEGTDYKLKLTAIEGEATPDKFVDVTADKPYYVTVQPMGGYDFDSVNGTNTYVWGIDKKDLAACDVTVTKNGEDFDLKVMNGNVTELTEDFDVTDNGDGTATVSVIDGGKNYTGSKTVAIIDSDDKGAVGMVEIADVKVDGNKATVILTGEAENAEGYDYVISTVDDWKNGRVDITKNQLKTTGDFFYVQKGTYYAYCHAYRRDENGVKVFSPEFSKTFKFTVTAITPEKPVITKVTRKGNDVTVTYTASKDAEGYDVVLGTANRVVNGERRPVDYGTLVKKNLKEGTTSVTFKNVPEGTYYAGLHAFNRSRQDNNNKVFSPWSNIKSVVVE